MSNYILLSCGCSILAEYGDCYCCGHNAKFKDTEGIDCIKCDEQLVANWKPTNPAEVRVYNALVRAYDYATWKEIARKSDKELLSLRNIGVESLAVIKQQLTTRVPGY